MSLRSLSLLLRVFISVFALLLTPGMARGHWCNTLWDSDYNIVVKPESDTLTLTGGTATLVLFVQNNMGYPLKNFQLQITPPSGFTVSASSQSPQNPKVAGYLMPGERVRVAYTINGSSGGVLQASALEFKVYFGNLNEEGNYNGQQVYYGDYGKPVLLKTSSPLDPAGILADGARMAYITSSNSDEAVYLRASAVADYEDLTTGLDALLTYFEEWDKISGCTPGGDTPIAAQPQGSWGEYTHLWTAGELAYRKDSLGSRLGAFRDDLTCAWRIDHLTFKGFAGFVLGYLNDSQAKTFLQAKAESNTENDSPDSRAIARAALVITDGSSSPYYAEVQQNASSGVDQVGSISAAALAIAAPEEAATTAAIQTQLLEKARWVEPDTSDEGRSLLAAHLLNLVAWQQRGWNPGATYDNENEKVAVYGGATITVPVDPTDPVVPVDPGGTGDNSKKAVCGCNSGTAAFLSVFLLLFAAARRRIRKS